MDWSKKERWENDELAHNKSGYPSRVLPSDAVGSKYSNPLIRNRFGPFM